VESNAVAVSFSTWSGATFAHRLRSRAGDDFEKGPAGANTGSEILMASAEAPVDRTRRDHSGTSRSN
jgi:hypothetical protein